MNIKNKFILFFSVILLAFISVLFFLLSQSEKMMTQSLFNDFSQIAQSTAKEVDIYLLERILSLETLSHNEGMKEAITGVDDTKIEEKTLAITGCIVTATGNILPSLESNQNPTKIASGTIAHSGTSRIAKRPDIITEDEHLQEVLKDFIKINTAFHSVEIISASGKTIAYIVENQFKGDKEAEGEKIVKKVISEKLGRDRSSKPLFIQASTGNDSYYIQDVVREDDGAYTIDIAVPIMLTQWDKKVFIGAILGDLHLRHIWDITDVIKIGTTGEVMLYNKSGATIADRYKEKILTYPKILVPSIQKVLRGETGHTIEISEMGTEAITAYAPLLWHDEYKGLGWGIQVTQDTSEAFKELRTFRLYSILLMVAIILLVLFFVYLIHTRISNPIIRLARIAKEIGNGNYLVDTRGVTKSSDSRDEINLLAQTFQDMLLNLRTNISLMEQYKHTIDQSSLVSKTDLRGIITYANKQFCDKAQYSEAELIGKPHNIVRHPDMPKEAFKDLWETISAKKIWKGIVKNRAKDGSEYWVAATVGPLLDIHGNIIEYMSVRTDITELQNTKDQLAESFKKLQENTEALIEGQRISREFELAKRIQDNFLPTVDSSYIPNLDTHCTIHTATEIGGDMYDIIPSEKKDEYLFYIGDVTGHGLISGIIMAIVSSLVYTINREVGGNLHRLLQVLNNIVIARIPKKMFVTMLFMKYKPATKTISYVWAGHERFLIYRHATDTVDILPSGGIAVGIFPNMFEKDTEKEFKLENGDVLFLFTDGITEAQNTEKTLFGVDRLVESFKKHHENSSKVLCDKIFDDLKDFTGSDIFVDDVTMMAFRATE